MDNSSSKTQKKLAVRIATAANAAEKEVLRIWIERLLEIKSSNLSVAQKGKEAIFATSNSNVLLPVVKLIASEIKRFSWDDRGIKGRLGLGGAVVGLTVFGGQGAGIAALGTAIGVPLWVVFGAGGAFVGVLYEEITGRKSHSKTAYRVIDVKSENEQ